MLAAGAYSFRQKSRLAISLSWVAGHVNVVVMLAAAHAVSHMTGNATILAERLAEARWSDAGLLFGILLAFVAGASLSTAITQGTRRRGQTSNYILPIACEALLLCLLWLMLELHHQWQWEHPLAMLGLLGTGAMAMGLQNATITRISGSVVRTTHLTGVFTDLGSELVHVFLWWRDRTRQRSGLRNIRLFRVMLRQQAFLSAALLASIIGSFTLGVIAGAWLHLHVRAWSMALPVGFLLWMILMDWRTPIADVKQINPLADPSMQGDTWIRQALPHDVGLWRLFAPHTTRHHRAPNFQKWAHTLPDHWRVVVLVVSPMTNLDTNAAIDLKLAIQQLHRQNRQLVITGLRSSQIQTLTHADLFQVLPRQHVCPTLATALAKAVSLSPHQPCA